jgi:Zn-dependent protease with chaperone function
MTTYILCSATIAALFVGAIIGGLVVLATGANDRVSRHREATIGRDAIAAARAADAAIAPQALAAEFSAWWRNQGWTFQPGPQTIQTHVAWAQHILNRGVDNG